MKEAISKLSEALKKVLEETTVHNDEPDKNVAMAQKMANKQATVLLRYLLSKLTDGDEEIAKRINLYYKSWERCNKYIWSEAAKYQQNGMAMIDDDTVYGWCYGYWFLDDKQAFDEEAARKEEEKRKAEEREKKDKELMEKARKKAIEELSAEEGWDALSDKEKENKITGKAYSIKYNLDSAEKRKEKVKEKAKEKAKDSKSKKIDSVVKTKKIVEPPKYTPPIDIVEDSIEQCELTFV